MTLFSHQMRRHTQAHPKASSGRMMQMSSSPSETDASGTSARPAGSEPQLANSTLCAFAECRRCPSIWYITRNGFAKGSDRAAPST